MLADQTVRLTAHLERRYGIRFAALRPIAEYGEAAGGVYRLDRRDGPPWMVRHFASNRPLDRIQGDAAVLAYVERFGVPAERLGPALDESESTDLDGQGVVQAAHRRRRGRTSALRAAETKCGQRQGLGSGDEVVDRDVLVDYMSQ